LAKIVQAKKGYTQWMRNYDNTIIERWKRIEEERWFDPSFQNFINTTIVSAIFEPIKNSKIEMLLLTECFSYV